MKNRVGYLSLNRETLDKMRSSSAGYRAADSVRQKMVGIGSLGMAGGITLELVYKPLRQKQHELELGLEVNAAQTACDLLKNSDLILGNIHQNDGHFTWFKLCEWMLVDILEKFGSSLDHTPWYFFPFMECIKLYFDVLFREANIVCQEYGPLKAYASQAFLTDLVPGVVMGFVFAQLEAMSAPLAALFPMQEEGVMVEEIVFHAATPSKMSRKVPLLESFRVKVDERICSVECLAEELPNANETGLFKMTLPTYKAMGQILVKLALVEPTVRILQISGLDLVQVRLTLQLSMESKDASTELERVRSHLAALEGVDFLFHYRFPCDCQSRRETGIQLDSSCNVALRVKVLSLVSLIHRVDSMDDVSIAQIYEVWNGW